METMTSESPRVLVEGFEANRAWARGTRESMARFGAGQMYVNFTGEGDEDKARASYPAQTYARLAAVKAHYDFPPTGSASTRTSALPRPDDALVGGREPVAAGPGPCPLSVRDRRDAGLRQG